MKQLKENVLYTDDDNEVFEIIKTIKKSGTKVPDMTNKGKSQIALKPYWNKGFHLYIILYFDFPGDSGYCAFHCKHILATGKELNFNILKNTGFDPLEVCTSIGQEIIWLAKTSNHQGCVSMAVSGDFIGFISTYEHPISEATNIDGKYN